jgi:hypothetical protein
MTIQMLYIIFIATADLFLYSILNKTENVGSTSLFSFWLLFLLVVIFHTSLFKFNFLLPFQDFIMIIQFLVGLTAFHFVGKYYIAKIQRSTRLSQEVISYSVKIASFLFLKAVFILVFVVQCMFILTRDFIHI